MVKRTPKLTPPQVVALLRDSDIPLSSLNTSSVERLTQISNEFVRIVGEGVDEVKKKKTSSLYSITDDDVVKACEMVGFGEVAQSVVLKSADDQGKKEKGGKGKGKGGGGGREKRSAGRRGEGAERKWGGQGGF